MYLSPGDETAIRLLEHSTVVMLRANPIKNVSPDSSAQHVDTEERGKRERKQLIAAAVAELPHCFVLATAPTLPHLQMCRAEH